MPELIYPEKPKPGDRVAVVSPSAGLPQLFGDVYELGLRRLRDELGLEPVEYPTTRVMGASAADRARDLHAAFADPQIKAVLCTIGGDDQITVTSHLDLELIRANPKPFLGYSDNTNLHQELWRAGVVSYYGGSVMVHLGRGGRTHNDTMASLRAALYSDDWFDLSEPLAFSDEDRDWADSGTLATERPVRAATGWTWHNAAGLIEGRTWGGCLEIVAWLLAAGRDVPTPAELAGQVLILETSEEMPGATEVFRTLRNIGERGLLGAVAAVLMGRPKAWSFERPLPVEERDEYAAAQRDAVLRAIAMYNPQATVVFDVDFGHTDPQLIIPYGGQVRIDGPGRGISVRY